MQRHDTDSCRGIDPVIRVERIERGDERGPVRHVGTRGMLGQEREDPLRRVKIDRFGDARGPAQREPCAAHHRRQRHPTALAQRGRNGSGESREARASFACKPRLQLVCAGPDDGIAQRPAVASADEREQVRERQSAPRCAQRCEPGRAIRGLHQRMRERGEIEHRLALGKPIQIDRRIRDSCSAQRRQQLREIGALAHEDRDRLRIAGQRGANAPHDRRGFERLAATDIQRHCRRWLRIARGERGLESDRAAPRRTRRRHLSKDAIDPIDQGPLRAEIARERQRLERHGTDSLPTLRIEKQADVGIAKTVDRLHRIADDEQRPGIARRPPGGQLFDQVALSERSVLIFVDQEMFDSKVEREQKLGGSVGARQRPQRDQGRFVEIDRAGIGEHELEPRGYARQHVEQRGDEAPRRLIVARRRQAPRRVQ